MIGILFATGMEATPFIEKGVPDNVVLRISGMGMPAAHAATEELIVKHGCTTIINAGVCGALDDQLERGSIHRVSMVDIEGESCPVHLEKEGLRLMSVEAPVFEPDRKAALSKRADLIDMEGYAVACVCEIHKTPCILIKGITDFGDDRGKDDIKENMDRVSKAVAEKVDQASRLILTKRDASSTLKKLRSFTKIEHTLFSLPLLFAGAWLGAGKTMPSIPTLLWIALVGLGARTFGMAANRILDKKIDAKNPRTKTRELPSGKLSMAQGIGVALAGLLIYFIACAGLGSTVLKLSWVPLIPLSLYSLLKRFTPLCHYGIGVCLGLAPLGAFVAVTNSLAFTPEVLLLTLFTFGWMSGFDMIYALLDIDFDRKNGVRSIPASLGATGAQGVAAVTHLVSIVALLFLVEGWLSGVAAAVSVIAFGAAYLPRIPVHVRFFPISAIAGIAGALAVLLRG